MQLPFGKTGKLLQLHSVPILVDVIKLQRVHRDDDDNSKKTENTQFFFFFIRKAHLYVSLHLGERSETSETSENLIDTKDLTYLETPSYNSPINASLK